MMATTRRPSSPVTAGGRFSRIAPMTSRSWGFALWVNSRIERSDLTLYADRIRMFVAGYHRVRPLSDWAVRAIPLYLCRSRIADASAAGAIWKLGREPGQPSGVARRAAPLARAGGSISTPLSGRNMTRHARLSVRNRCDPTTAPSSRRVHCAIVPDVSHKRCL
jgi:hypothetical protein